MIKVLAIDDEPLALEQISIYISKTPSLKLVKACSSASDAISEIEKGDIDAIFLDINMPDMTGMEMAKQLKQSPLIIFTTAYSEFAIEGYKVNAVDYLLKPFSLNEFQEAVKRLQARYELVNSSADRKKEVPDTLFVKSEYKIVKLSIKTITHAESMGEYMKIHTCSAGKNTVTFVLMTVGKLLDQLPDGDFLRIHRSYIVNLNHIDKVTKGMVILDTGKAIPIGDSYKGDLKAWMGRR